MAAIVMMLAWASVVLSQDGGGDPWLFGTRGMPRPDGIQIQTDPGTGQRYTYTARARRDGSIVIQRNGVAWVTLATQHNDFLLSDPNGTGRTIVRMFQSDSRGGGTPVKVRAQVR